MDRSPYLYVALRAALDAGKVIMDIYDDPQADFGVEMKQDYSPLTRADKAAHEIIALALAATPFPVLSEEGRNIPFEERAGWKTLWIVDPLDGTKEFIKRNGEFTVNIALVERGIPTIGVIYVPVRRELYYASEEGAYKVTDVDCADQPSYPQIMRRTAGLPSAGSHDGMVIVASRSHQSPETVAFIEKIRNAGKPVSLISSGSSLKICSVAEGTADIYPRFAPTMEWDTAAGDAIARAVGCTLRRTDDHTPLVYNKEDLRNPWFICTSADCSGY